MAIILNLVIRKRIDALISRIEAYFHFFKRLSILFSQRTFVQKRIRKINDEEIKKLMVKPNPCYYLWHTFTHALLIKKHLHDGAIIQG